MSFQAFDRSSIESRAPRNFFIPTTLPRPHPLRRRAILAAHPEAASLIGHDPVTAVITLATVIGQTLIAAGLGSLGLEYWWVALLAAFCIGAFANHAMFVVIHDANSQLHLQSQCLEQMGRNSRRFAEHFSVRDGISLLPHEAPFASRRL